MTQQAVVQAQFKCTTNNGTITITGYTGSAGAVKVLPHPVAVIPGDLPREELMLKGRYPGQRLRRPCWAILLLPPSERRPAEPASPTDGGVAFRPIRFPVARYGWVRCGTR